MADMENEMQRRHGRGRRWQRIQRQPCALCIACQQAIIQERRLLARFAVDADEQHAAFGLVQPEWQVVGIGEDFGWCHLDGVFGIGGSVREDLMSCRTPPGQAPS